MGDARGCYGLILGIFVLLSGCATVVNGTTQKVGIASTPTGADVLIDNQQRIVTPATVALDRSASHTFLFKKDGFQDDSFVVTSSTSGWVWGNILLGGLVGGVVDFASGGARKLSQDSIHVTLVPLAAHDTAAPSPAIVPAVATLTESTPSSSREAQLLELKNLLDKSLITQEEYNKKRQALVDGL